MTEKKGKGGRPKTYPGEENIRVSIAIRPRYRQALEYLANERKTSLNEAIEYVIAVASRTMKIDGKPILDYIRPPEEPIRMLIESLNYDKTKQGNHNEKTQYINEYSKLPKSFHSPMNNYIVEIITKGSIKFFIFEKLIEALQEFWKQGIPIQEVLDYIENIFEFVKKNPEYIDLNNEHIFIKWVGEKFELEIW